jgi:hypothetical protein
MTEAPTPRQTWMREVNELLLAKGITDDLTSWARLAFDRGQTPVEFANQLAPRPR